MRVLRLVKKRSTGLGGGRGETYEGRFEVDVHRPQRCVLTNLNDFRPRTTFRLEEPAQERRQYLLTSMIRPEGKEGGRGERGEGGRTKAASSEADVPSSTAILPRLILKISTRDSSEGGPT